MLIRHVARVKELLPDTPATMGMIEKVAYLVRWERVDAPPPLGRAARAKPNVASSLDRVA